MTLVLDQIEDKVEKGFALLHLPTGTRREPGGIPWGGRYYGSVPDRRAAPKPQGDNPWKPVRSWQKFFGSDVEYYAVLQSRKDPLLFMATRSFVVGGFEQDYKKEHRAVNPTEAHLILRNPESFFNRMDL